MDDLWNEYDEASLLLEGIEDYAALFYLTWALNGRYPNQSNVARARALTKHLIKRGLVKMFVETHLAAGDPRPADLAETESFLADDRQWETPLDDSSPVALIGTTEEGEARWTELSSRGITGD